VSFPFRFARLRAPVPCAHLPCAARIAVLLSALVLANALVWLWALALFHAQPLMLGTAVLAWGWACAMRWMPITSPRSTMSRAS
jgi:high-affinity nickel-transport protein